jgi:hypothetical protein
MVMALRDMETGYYEWATLDTLHLNVDRIEHHSVVDVVGEWFLNAAWLTRISKRFKLITVAFNKPYDIEGCKLWLGGSSAAWLGFMPRSAPDHLLYISAYYALYTLVARTCYESLQPGAKNLVWADLQNTGDSAVPLNREYPALFNQFYSLTQTREDDVLSGLFSYDPLLGAACEKSLSPRKLIIPSVPEWMLAMIDDFTKDDSKISRVISVEERLKKPCPDFKCIDGRSAIYKQWQRFSREVDSWKEMSFTLNALLYGNFFQSADNDYVSLISDDNDVEVIYCLSTNNLICHE